MKVATFRTLMVCLAIIAFFTFTALGIFLLLKPSSQTKCPVPRCPVMLSPPQQQQTPDRDRLALNDPLYPPENRTEKQTRDGVVDQIQRGHLYQNQDKTRDAFRLVGYLTNNEQELDAGRNNWKLFARMKDRHTGEYYIIPTNNNLDLKIPLTQDVVVGERLRDVYTLPKEMRFNSPMLNRGTYVFTEIPKEELSGIA